MDNFIVTLLLMAIAAGAGYLYARSKYRKLATLDVAGNDAGGGVGDQR